MVLFVKIQTVSCPKTDFRALGKRLRLFRTKYSIVDQVKFVEDTFKNFTWSTLEYFVPFSTLLMKLQTNSLQFY